jgi:hypothetical protein
LQAQQPSANLCLHSVFNFGEALLQKGFFGSIFA